MAKSKNKRKVIKAKATTGAIARPKKRRRVKPRRGIFSPSEMKAFHQAFITAALGQRIASAIMRFMPVMPVPLSIEFDGGDDPLAAECLVDYDEILDAEFIVE